MMLREVPYAAAKRSSVERKMARAAYQPRHLPEFIRWFLREWQAELPPRLHEMGVEPQSALGSPRLAGAFRAYISGSPMATDHDDRLDISTGEDARLLPIHAALCLLERKWPLSTRFLFLLACNGGNWEDITLAWQMLPEVGHRFAHDALRHLWAIWQRDAKEIA